MEQKKSKIGMDFAPMVLRQDLTRFRDRFCAIRFYLLRQLPFHLQKP